MTAGAPDDAALSRRLSGRPGFPGPYVERVRAATARLAARPSPPDDVRATLELLREHARIDPTVPARSARPGGAYAKVAIRKLVGWYVRFVTDQMSVLGAATARFGGAVANRLDRLEADNHALRRRVADLEARSADAGDAETTT